MTRRERLRVLQIAVLATLFLWGFFMGMSSASVYQETSDWPFSDLAMIMIGTMVVLGLLLAIAPATREISKAVAMSVAAFTLAVVLGHLLGGAPGGPQIKGGGGKAGNGPVSAPQ